MRSFFYNPTAVPEPATTALFGTGLLLLTLSGLRRYRHSVS
jgi:hypothetical protein